MQQFRFGWPVALAAALALAGCDVTVQPAPTRTTPAANIPPQVSTSQAISNFDAVVARVEPVAEQVCRERTRGANCDFNIVIDTKAGLAPNAYQTVDGAGRPVIGFTAALVKDARNRDELAFILGHEAAHHIAGHIPRTQQNATAGALIGGIFGAAVGVDVQTASNLGGSLGARRFSKDYELEADALGTRIAARAGYDPLRGVQYFQRTPDPGDRFLGTHPPNGDRIRIVQQTAAGL